ERHLPKATNCRSCRTNKHNLGDRTVERGLDREAIDKPPQIGLFVERERQLLQLGEALAQRSIVRLIRRPAIKADWHATDLKKELCARIDDAQPGMPLGGGLDL